MIALADSGSTKTDWLIYNSAGEIISETGTPGFNPYFQSPGFICEEILGNSSLRALKKDITHLYFFCAGCGSEERKKQISDTLKNIFINTKIEVAHDLAAAVYATYNHEPCISCILGTGSNSAYFDGEEIFQKNRSLAYILGDEGSGSWFGKKLLSAFFHAMMPSDLYQEFKDQFSPDLDEVLEHVYKRPHPNVYLAGFMPFMSANKGHPWIQDLLKKGFISFFKHFIFCYDNYRKHPVHFVGSVAWHNKDVLMETARDNQISIGVIHKKPLRHLYKYFRENAF